MNIVGKTIKEVRYPSQYENITLVFTDGTTLEVREHGQVGELKVFFGLSESMKKICEERGIPFIDISDDALNV